VGWEELVKTRYEKGAVPHEARHAIRALLIGREVAV